MAGEVSGVAEPPAPDELRRMTLAEIARLVAGLRAPRLGQAEPTDEARLEEWRRVLGSDDRAGVRRLAERLEGSEAVRRRDRERVAALLEAETRLCPSGVRLVAGIDEAGRGPLAGPVVAAAVILKPGVIVPGLDDSKRLTEARRERLYAAVTEASLAVGVGIAGTGLVERLNVLQATYVAMRRAAERLAVRPDYVLVDGFQVPGLGLPQRGVVKGDARCASIAAASIVAKVTRDRIMRCVARRFPDYGFEQNKGYATAAHRRVLLDRGPCPAHRRSFLGALDRRAGLFAGEGETGDG